MKKILVIHGPNLNLLGKREPHIYGDIDIKKVNSAIKETARKHKVAVDILQSNHEGEIVDAIGKAKKTHHALLINPAAYTHTSVAIRDAILATGIPTVEVHLSNIYAREEFRHNSLIAPVARGQISGFGIDSYMYGMDAAIKLVKKKRR